MAFPPAEFRESRFGCPGIARVASSEELGTMSKNNLRGITLVRGPIWGSHSPTLIISWNNRLPFVGIENFKTGHHLETSVYRKKTNKGLFLHCQSHVDIRYKQSFLLTMLNRANRLSSTPDLFSKECRILKTVFLNLKYPEKLIDSTISRFNRSLGQVHDRTESTGKKPIALFCLLKAKIRLILYAETYATFPRR